jgi:hypothetical protein
MSNQSLVVFSLITGYLQGNFPILQGKRLLAARKVLGVQALGQSFPTLRSRVVFGLTALSATHQV